MRFGFRVATDPRFGAGHLARCRAMVRALREDVTLFADPGDRQEVQHSNWAEVVLEKSAESAAAATEALSFGRIDALVIDSYALDANVVAKAAAAGTTIAFRDDQAYGPETITIDCNPGTTPGTTILAGPSYMPLSPEFTTAHDRARRVLTRMRTPTSIMIAFGARDSANCTAIALDAVARLSDMPRTAVAVSTNAVHADMLMRKIENLPWVARLDDRCAMSDFYCDFDLAIGASGVSQFERACCGLPTILLAQNERQKPLVAAWMESGAAICCEPESQTVGDVLTELMNNPKRVADMRERGLDLVDGRGARRLADALKARLTR